MSAVQTTDSLVPNTRSVLPTAERILDVAEEQFAKHGYAGTSIRDIAAAVGLQKASLYNHYSSKDELYAAVLERGFAPIIAMVERFIARENSAYMDPIIIDELVEAAAQRPTFSKLVLFEALTGGAHINKLIQDWVVPAMKHGLQFIANGPEQSYWNKDELPLLELMIHNLIISYFSLTSTYQQVTGKDPLSREELDRQKQFLNKLWQCIWWQMVNRTE